uniref:Uncharacterized protein n=1 Tax=Chelydra serpentina TaxID=8475 RepID=A0A8C3XPK3_CHESE
APGAADPTLGALVGTELSLGRGSCGTPGDWEQQSGGPLTQARKHPYWGSTHPVVSTRPVGESRSVLGCDVRLGPLAGVRAQGATRAADGRGRGPSRVWLPYRGGVDFVAGTLLLRSLAFLPQQLQAVIHLPESREFDISFRLVKEMFAPGWSVMPGCCVLARVPDKYELWMGEFWETIQLLRHECDQLRHVPNMFYIGAERGYVWDSLRQWSPTFLCGSSEHFSSRCSSCLRWESPEHRMEDCQQGIVAICVGGRDTCTAVVQRRDISERSTRAGGACSGSTVR